MKIGDKVTRYLAVGGELKPMMEMTVTGLDYERNLIHCGEWAFDLTTGGEVDEDIPTPPGIYLTVISPPCPVGDEGNKRE